MAATPTAGSTRAVLEFKSDKSQNWDRIDLITPFNHSRSTQIHSNLLESTTHQLEGDEVYAYCVSLHDTEQEPTCASWSVGAPVRGESTPLPHPLACPLDWNHVCEGGCLWRGAIGIVPNEDPR